MIQLVNGVVSKRINSENLARKGDSKAAINPSTVIGAITGATKILAGIVTGATGHGQTAAYQQPCKAM